MGRPCSAWGCPGWKSPCRSVLLACSVLLSSCFLPSQGQSRFINVVADPAKPKLGGEVTLIPQGAMNDSFSCHWYRGDAAHWRLILVWFGPPHNGGTEGAQYTHRERIEPIVCSLRVTNLNADDCTTFYVSLDKPGLWETGSVNLEIEGVSCRGRSGSVPNGVVAGIAVACLLVVLALGGMLYFHRAQTSA